jgi:molybdopterin-guanine dinucleotide biosynthesis protein B
MKNPKIIGFYGESNTGKTTLITKITQRLNSENFKIATVKITYKDIGIDKKGKDTWRYCKAGSNLVVLSSPVETSYIIKEQTTIKKIIDQIKKFGKYDFILIEGLNSPDIPKIKIGDIPERQNTIFNYKDDFEEVIKIIKKCRC